MSIYFELCLVINLQLALSTNKNESCSLEKWLIGLAQRKHTIRTYYILDRSIHKHNNHPSYLHLVVQYSSHGFNIFPRLGTYGKRSKDMMNQNVTLSHRLQQWLSCSSLIWSVIHVEVVPRGSFVAFCTQKFHCCVVHRIGG